MISTLLLSCVLTTAQPTDRADWLLTPQLHSGLELVYSGVYIDETLVPGAQHQRHYRLDAHLLVLDAGVKDWHVAFMTALSLQDARQPLDKKADGPTSLRLQQAKVDGQGRVHTFDKKLLEIPLHGPANIECGFLVPAPFTKVGRNFVWEVNEPGQPAQRWQIVGTESSGGVQCVKITGVVQSDDWERPRADRTAWRRRDTILVHPQLNVAQKVERIIEERAPARDTATQRRVVRYDLDSSLRYPGRAFEERKDEVLKASKFHEDAQLLLRQPVFNRTLADSLIQRVSFHLERQSAREATPYRKAVAQVKTLLEKAKQGDVPAPRVADEPLAPLVKAADIGQRVPAFAVSSLTEEKTVHLKSLMGKPVLVMFYNPATQLGRDVLRYAKTLSDEHPDKISVMAMAVTNDTDLARKQQRDMKLPFPILDGNGMRLTFGAQETPRFVLLDRDGVVRHTQTGWGYHVPVEIESSLEQSMKR